MLADLVVGRAYTSQKRSRADLHHHATVMHRIREFVRRYWGAADAA